MKRTFCKKRIEVEAIQFDNFNVHELQAFVGDEAQIRAFKTGTVFLARPCCELDLITGTDWIVRDRVNPLRVVNNTEFNDKYEVCKT